jgi:hypothetical protein
MKRQAVILRLEVVVVSRVSLHRAIRQLVAEAAQLRRAIRLPAVAAETL